MRLLLIADEEDPLLWENFKPERLENIDMILSCGDLDPDYLSFLATFFHGPVVYVPGNHDSVYQQRPPEGCICADDKLVKACGLRIVGLGGCMRYKKGDYQYTESEMRRRVFRLLPFIALHGGFDILLTHAPARGLGDGEDNPHKGFEVFKRLMERYRPQLMAHGHQHQAYDYAFIRERKYADTRVINGCGRTIVELEISK